MKITIIYLSVFLCFVLLDNVSAQVSKTAKPEKIYQEAETIPEFPGGEKALFSYFKKALGTQTFPNGGKIIVKLVLTKEGWPTNVEIAKSFIAGVDAVILKAVQAMPNWQPAMLNGQPVNFQMLLPVLLPKPKPTEPPVINEKVYHAVQISSEFKGGDAALKNYLKKNLRYPSGSKQYGIEGRVLIKFVVSQTGEVKDWEVIKGPAPDLNAEALRVVKEMPAWTPGYENGKPVNVQCVLPVTFQF